MAEKTAVKKNTKTTAKATTKAPVKGAPKAAANKTATAVVEKPKQLVRAHARNLRISPRKLRLVTNMVKNMRVGDALVQLQFTNKKGAPMIAKLLQSAVANAEHNFSLNRDGLVIKSITCDMGPVLQRAFPRARGSAFVIRHKMSHVNVILEEKAIKAKKAAAKVPRAKKESKPVQTVEGSVGLPEMGQAEKLPEQPKAKEVHHENEADSIPAKTDSDNTTK
jgi:large subunit ribosomal protein L22